MLGLYFHNQTNIGIFIPIFMLLDVKKDELKQRSFNLRAEPLSSLFPFPLVFYLERS